MELEIKVMTIEEKYERLLNQINWLWAEAYDFNKKQGTTDQWLDYLVNAEKKMLPYSTGLSKGFLKFIKTIAPGKTFKESISKFVYDQQKWHSHSNLELVWISDQEAIYRVNDCPLIKKYQQIIKKIGADITPKYICEHDMIFMKNLAKEFGISLTPELMEKGCQVRARLL
jgi:hypothetical protein